MDSDKTKKMTNQKISLPFWISQYKSFCEALSVSGVFITLCGGAVQNRGVGIFMVCGGIFAFWFGFSERTRSQTEIEESYRKSKQ